MRRNRLWWALAGLCMAFVVLAVMPWPRTQPVRLTREKFDRVLKGMTRAEVDAILGPSGDYTTVPVVLTDNVVGVAGPGGKAESELPYDTWMDDSAAIWVGCNESGTVAYTIYNDNFGRQQGVLYILYRRFEDRFWRWFGDHIQL